MPIAYRSVLSSSGIVADSLTISNPPTTTRYIQGDTLDTTGLVVIASFDGVSGDVTNRCTIIPRILNDSGTQTISVLYGGKTATFDVTVEAINAITITTPPTKTEYILDEQLDLTGIVVVCTTTSFTRDITNECTFNPEDGTSLTTEGTFNVTVSWRGVTTSQQYKVSHIPVYGAEWNGGSSSAWTRTDDAVGFAAPSPAVNNGNGSSPFDNILPWSGMKRVTDASAGVLVEIPKYYYKWTRTGTKMKLQISMSKEPGFLTSPAHADRGDGKGERDVVYVGAYKCATSTYKSTSGVKPQGATSKSAFRTNIHNLGTTIWQNDYAMWWTIRMLYLVEYADWNSQTKIGYGGGNGSSIENSGLCNSMTYHTGTNAASRTTYGHTRYRYIEDLWGNTYEICDGIYFSYDNIYCIKNPANFSDTSNGTYVGKRSTTNGYIKAWSISSESGFEYAIYPSETGATGTTYSCDYCYFGGNTGKVLFTGGYYGRDDYTGAFFMNGNENTTLAAAHVGSRLMKLP